jgi:hypothetical protein
MSTSAERRAPGQTLRRVLARHSGEIGVADSGIVVQPRAANICAANRACGRSASRMAARRPAGAPCDCPDAAWSSGAITDCCGASATETASALSPGAGYRAWEPMSPRSFRFHPCKYRAPW